MKWLFLLCCPYLCWSLETFSSNPLNISVPYLHLTNLHHQQILDYLRQNPRLQQVSEETPKEICMYQGYHGYKTPQITELITQEMVQRSLDVKGSFEKLRTKMQLKSRDWKALNVLFIGGSVCVGHGCHQCKDTESVLTFNEASFQCSWTHRFTRDLEYIMKQIKPHRKTFVSPRYCCKSATSTNIGLDILITKSYRSPNCQLTNAHITSKTSSDWEPDLIFWDYSANDISNRVRLSNSSFIIVYIHQWFQKRSRRDVYEGFVRKILNMTSKPQLITFESINRRSDLNASELRRMEDSRDDRIAINRFPPPPTSSPLFPSPIVGNTTSRW
jgi:hypothetical protein